MLRSTLAASACGLALLVPVSTASPVIADEPAARAGSPLTGTWKGRVGGDDGADGSYAAKVRIFTKAGKLRGKITYPGLCTGAWKKTGKKGGWTTFRETISDGPCVSPVQVKVKRQGAKLKVVWREPVSGDQASMLAKKA